MSNSLNRLQFIGKLGKDPVMRYTPSGKAVTNFPVAVNERYTRDDGEDVENTIWYTVTTWGNSAEACNQYLSKGKSVYVEGRLRADPETGGPRIWGEDEPHASFEVSASYVQFLSEKSKGRGDNPYEGEEEEEEKPARKKGFKTATDTKKKKQPWMQD